MDNVVKDWKEAEQAIYEVLGRHRIGTLSDGLEKEIADALRAKGLLLEEL